MLSVFLSIALYPLPGFIFSRLTSGKLRNNVFFWLFLSSITLPFLYQFLAYLKILSLISYLLLLGLLFLLVNFLNLKRIDLDKVFPTNHSTRRDVFSILAIGALGVFLVLLLLPRIGLWQGNFPIGDDRHRMGKIISVAESPNVPLFYRFPTTPLTIYYFDQVQPGLMVRFSNNEIKTNQAWVIHNFLRGLVLVWLIWLLAWSLIKDSLGRLVTILSLTFIGGLEFYLQLIKGVSINHVEWWTDWWGPQFYIHMQISNPFTSAFWVPQHYLGGLLTIPLYLLLISKEKNNLVGKLLLALILASILGYSAFVFVTVVIGLALYFLIRIFLKEEKLIPLLKDNFWWGIISLGLSSPLIYLFAEADKESYFSFGLNSFQFFNNYLLVNKIINFLITIPYFLIVELSVLFIVLLFSLYLFFKERLWRSTLLFWYLMMIPLGVMFVFRAADDNNISMRSTLPSLIALAIFSGFFVRILINRLKKVLNKRFLYLSLMIILLWSFPSNLTEFFYRYQGQFTETYGLTSPIFETIDRKLPLNSIVFTQKPLHDSVTALGHRFTFKPLLDFNPTDKEYASYKKIRQFEREEDILKLIKANKEIEDFDLYHLVDLDQKQELKGFEVIERSGNLVLYRLKGIEEAVSKK